MKKNDWYNVVFVTVTTCLVLCLLTMLITSAYAATCKPAECPANCGPGILYGCKAVDPRMDSCGQSGDEPNCGGCECKQDSAGQCGCML